MSKNIISLIVSYNRITLLKEVLKSYEELNVFPEKVLIVDNNSTDGSKEFLEIWLQKKGNFEKEVIFLKENLGGSGGFYEGLKSIRDNKNDFDWIYISDDDAIPEKTIFDKFLKILSSEKKHEKIGAICSKVINNGKIDLIHRRNINKKNKVQIFSEEMYKQNFFYLNTFSYVGTFLNKDVLSTVGLPERDYFIWYDDTEHSYRISKEYKIKCYPELEVHHNVSVELNKDINWKSYYGIRNQAHMLKKHFCKRTYLRYCYEIKIKNLIKYILKKRTYEEYLFIKTAINDGMKGKLGLHKKYKPGFKLK
ncbi:MAG: glycosyltransferase [Cetobacterium sp.]